MADLGVLHHQAETGHAVIGEPGEVPIDGRKVLTAEEALELVPGDGVVLTYGVPGPAIFGDEVRGAGSDLDPGETVVGRPGQGGRAAHVVGNDGPSC
jgi:hypothetical protein